MLSLQAAQSDPKQPLTYLIRNLGVKDSNGDGAQRLSSRPIAGGRKVAFANIIGTELVLARVRTIPVNLHDVFAAVLSQTKFSLSSGGGAFTAAGGEGEGLAWVDGVVVDGGFGEVAVFV